MRSSEALGPPTHAQVSKALSGIHRRTGAGGVRSGPFLGTPSFLGAQAQGAFRQQPRPPVPSIQRPANPSSPLLANQVTADVVERPKAAAPMRPQMLARPGVASAPSACPDAISIREDSAASSPLASRSSPEILQRPLASPTSSQALPVPPALPVGGVASKALKRSPLAVSKQPPAQNTKISSAASPRRRLTADPLAQTSQLSGGSSAGQDDGTGSSIATSLKDLAVPDKIKPTTRYRRRCSDTIGSTQ